MVNCRLTCSEQGDMSKSEVYNNSESFNPKKYSKTFLSLSSDAEPLARELTRFRLQQLHEFYEQHGPQLTGCRILEYGGGPGHVYPLISAAPYASEIVFAEYAEQNLKVAEEWRSNKSEALDLTPLFQHVVSSLERNKDENAVEQRETSVRSLITQIVPCDINESDALRDVTLPFDVVSTHFCLVTAVASVEQYTLGLQKLARLLRPGGMIVMTESIGGTFYRVEGKKLHNLHLGSTEVVRQSLVQAGFTNVSMKTMKRPPSELNDIVEYAFVTAVLASA